MRGRRIPILAITVALTLIGAGGVLTLQYQQHASAFIDPWLKDFKKLAHEFEKNVIGDPGISQGPAPHLRELLDTYAQDFMRISLGGPDTLPGILVGYQSAVLVLLSAPPEPDKQQQHDQIKEFRQLTNEFEKAVISAVTDPEN